MTSQQQEVIILLATYNGGRYLSEQIQSIQAQSWQNWKLVIRDDGSIDNTLEIIHKLASTDKRILLIQDELAPTRSATGNFNILMQYALKTGAEYIMFSDQDDVWKPDKISTQMKHIQKMEKTGPNRPYLVHTDLEVVNENCEEVNHSFMKFQSIHHEYDNALKVLVVQNFVTGCTVLINRRLLEFALPIPDNIIMHDWWLALSAASVDGLEFLDQSTVKYRQHSDNQIGAKGYWSTLGPFYTGWLKRLVTRRTQMESAIQQARSLLERAKTQNNNKLVPADTIALLEDYCNILSHSRTKRLTILNDAGIHKQDSVRQQILKVCLFIS